MLTMLINTFSKKKGQISLLTPKHTTFVKQKKKLYSIKKKKNEEAISEVVSYF